MAAEDLLAQPNDELQWIIDGIASMNKRAKVKLAQAVISRKVFVAAKETATLALQQRALVDDTWQRRFGLLSQQLKVDVINYIVCFDISHTMGEETVSACVVVSRDGGHDRQKSRRLKINDITPGDDYAALKQALKRFTKNLEGNKVQYWPDVYLIDGGKGQVNAACEAIKALNLPNAPIILGMVKGDHRRTENDRVVIPGESFEMPLAKLSEAGILLQNIRDLAHNEAIRFIDNVGKRSC